MCVLSIKAPIRKKSGNLFNDPRIYIYIYIYICGEDKGVPTFPKGICPKVNAIARLEYELADYDSAIQRFSHYTTRTPPDWNS